MGRPGVGPGRPINLLCDGPRPDPARQIFRGWAAARSGPSNIQTMGRGPGQPITFPETHGLARPGPSFFQKSRPGPAHHMAARPMRHGLYMGRPDNYLGRPMCCPVLKGACAYADVIFCVSCWFFVVFSPSGFRRTAVFGL